MSNDLANVSKEARTSAILKASDSTRKAVKFLLDQYKDINAAFDYLYPDADCPCWCGAPEDASTQFCVLYGYAIDSYKAMEEGLLSDDIYAKVTNFSGCFKKGEASITARTISEAVDVWKSNKDAENICKLIEQTVHYPKHAINAYEALMNYAKSLCLRAVDHLLGLKEFTYPDTVNLPDANGNLNCTNCKNCHNCIDCHNCTDCEGCDYCNNCNGCCDCRYCNDCVECEECCEINGGGCLIMAHGACDEYYDDDEDIY